jgi:hypothetical protein
MSAVQFTREGAQAWILLGNARTVRQAIVSAQTSTLIEVEPGIKTIAAVHSQCLSWVKTRSYRTATATAVHLN